MFALGANEEAARVSGVNVFLTTILVFAAGQAPCMASPLHRGCPDWLQHRKHRLQLRAGRHCGLRHRRVSFDGGIGKIRGVYGGVLMLR
jgi:methyl-galactoside transport system permease protein